MCRKSSSQGSFLFVLAYTDPPVCDRGIFCLSVDSVDLKQYILLGDGINSANVRFEIVSGSGISTLTDGVLTFTGAGIVTVAVYTGDAASPENRIEIRMLHN